MKKDNNRSLKVVAIIQARMDSTRLPGKVLKTVLNKTLLEYQLERVQRSRLIDEIIIATTRDSADEDIVKWCKKNSVGVYRGSEHDVLARYYEAAIEYKADVIVRLTSDCPLIDFEVVDQVIQLYLDMRGEIDYASNTLERTFPRGMDTEVFSFSALQKAYANAVSKNEREHVTTFIYKNPHIFKIQGLTYSYNLSKYRWTVDTEEDFELIRQILLNIYPNNPTFVLKDLIELVERNPSWNDINAHIEQKK
ncbi:cytidylyltransferase domain-containing protein [Sporosarcina sp. ITBMC105]